MKKFILILAAAIGLAACEGGSNEGDKSFDRGIDRKNLAALKAGIWIDPNGCHHWIIDDGIEGYMSMRLDDRGKPVCTPAVPGGVAVGDFKSGSSFPDIL